MKELVIFGLHDFADIAYEYFSYDSDYEVVGFCVEKDYITDDTKFGLPIYQFEDLENHITPNDVHFFAAISYAGINDLRTRIVSEAKGKGYTLASYISSKAFVGRNTVNQNTALFLRITHSALC